jgi:hypothetical protein
MYNQFMEDFADWLDRKYREWEKRHGRKSETEFAKEMHISQANVNAWRLRTRGAPKQKELIDKIGAVYPDVYEVLGFPKSTEVEHDPLTREVDWLLGQLSEDRRKQVVDYIRFLAQQEDQENAENHSSSSMGKTGLQTS